MSSDSPTVDPSGEAAPRPPGQSDRPDLRELLVRHHEAVFRYAYRLAGNQADAEDLTQQAFLVAQQRLNQVRDMDKVLAWLFSVLRNCYLKDLRRQRRLVSDGAVVDIEQVPEPPPRDEIDEAEVQLALDELPDEFKIVVLMFYFEDCSYKEIAARLNIPLGTVMSRLARAKGHLRRWLTRRTMQEEKGENAVPLMVDDHQHLTSPMQVSGPIRMDR
jgi:RNA polymerase sigma-70 factor, ECF subfamily